MATIYILELIFVIFTYYISSAIAFLPYQFDNLFHNSAVVITLDIIAFFITLTKVFFKLSSKSIKKGIMLIYVTDIMKSYVRSIIFFVDIIYLVIMVLLFITCIFLFYLVINESEVVNIIALILFIWAIIKILMSKLNLNYIRTAFIDSLKK